jgi:Zn-dependent M28 family amino/carboxypeptidase
MRTTQRRFRTLGLILLFAMSFVLVAPAAMADDISSTQGFRNAVKVADVRAHQKTLQTIANRNGGTRLAGTPGHEQSADYVYDRMGSLGYRMSFQEFEFPLVADVTPPVFQRISPNPATFVDGVDFGTIQYSGSGNVTAQLVAVDLVVPPVGPANGNTSGCEAADFAGFPAGAIALLQRGTCTFRIKADNAAAAGAIAVVIFNEGQPGRTAGAFGTLAPPIFDRPVLSASFAVGDALRNGVLNGPTGVTVSIQTNTTDEIRITCNIIAETRGGDPNHVIVLGAHLDSVSRGPGINDNGSGSAVLLAIAEAIAKQKITVKNKLRFIWFGAEEEGLLGSQAYVASLTQAQLDKIEAMLNFDMVGSPNFVRFVYDGNNSAGGGAVGPPGSSAIEQIFIDYFTSQGLATDPTPFNGRSDYGPFIAAGIPAGGLFTGAEGAKTVQQAAIYGGTAGEQYDPCYHLACDTYANNSNTALDQMSDAAAHITYLFAKRDFVANPLVDPVTTLTSGSSSSGGLEISNLEDR